MAPVNNIKSGFPIDSLKMFEFWTIKGLKR